MNDTALPKWFWGVAGLALIWNLMGVFGFYAHVSIGADQIAQMPAAEQALYTNAPSWVTIAFAVAVFAGLIASIGLLLRKTWAFPMFVISLLGVIAQQIHMYFLSSTFEVLGKNQMVLPALVLLIALLLAWFSHRSSMRGWLS